MVGSCHARAGATSSSGQRSSGNVACYDRLPAMTALGANMVERPVRGGFGAGRVAVVFERGGAGTAALREAAELANAGSELSVVTLAPQARPAIWGRAGGEGPYNIAIREE